MENTTPKLGIIESDPWLEPYSAAIEGRHQHALDKELELTGGKGTLSDFATGYLYFGLHRTRRGWVFREWAPNAKEIYLIGDFNDWKEHGDYRMYHVKNSPGVWEVELQSGKSVGMAVKENAYRHGPTVWYRMSRQRYSVHRSGNRRILTGLERRCSVQRLIL